MQGNPLLACAAAMFLAAGGAAKAACDKVTFSDVGWTDITVTTSWPSMCSKGSAIRWT